MDIIDFFIFVVEIFICFWHGLNSDETLLSLNNSKKCLMYFLVYTKEKIVEKDFFYLLKKIHNQYKDN